MAGPLALAVWCVGAIGLLDDARGVGPLAKLAVQIGAAVYLYFNGFQVHGVSNPFGGAIELGPLALPLTVLWLVGMSNAFNLIDGLDGLAAGLALVATLGLLVAAALSGRSETVLVAVALAGALVGFLPYNVNPARVFLGDCGALPVGFLLAAIAVKSSMKASAAVAVAVPLLALALPILDACLAVVRRVVRRRPVFVGDHDHIHHRLVDLGLTPRRAVITLYAVAVLFTALAMAVAMGPDQVTWAAAVVVLLVVWAGVRALGYWEVTEFQRSLLTRIVAGLRTTGDTAIERAERDIARTDSIEAGWERLCATAWELGMTELHLAPMPAWQAECPDLHRVAPVAATPGPFPISPALMAATWSIDIEWQGQVVAECIVRRPLTRVDYDPGRFAQIVLGLVRRRLDASPRRAGPPGTTRRRVSAWAPLAWFAYRLRPTGDAALRGLEAELSRVTTFDEGWARVCDTAWSLGFVELRLLPLPGASDLLEERHGFAAAAAPRPGAGTCSCRGYLDDRAHARGPQGGDAHGAAPPEPRGLRADAARGGGAGARRAVRGVAAVYGGRRRAAAAWPRTVPPGPDAQRSFGFTTVKLSATSTESIARDPSVTSRPSSVATTPTPAAPPTTAPPIAPPLPPMMPPTTAPAAARPPTMPASFFLVDGARSASGFVRSDTRLPSRELNRLERERHAAASLGGLGGGRFRDRAAEAHARRHRLDALDADRARGLRRERVADARRLGRERRVDREPQARARGHRHVQARRAAHHAPDDSGCLLGHEAAAFAGEPRLAAENAKRIRGEEADGQQGRHREGERRALPDAGSGPGWGDVRGRCHGGLRGRQRRRLDAPAGRDGHYGGLPRSTERLDEVGPRGVALRRVLRGRALQDRADLGRQAGRREVHGRRLLGQDLHEDHRDALAREGLAAGEALVEHAAEREEIGAAVDPHALRLLGGHVVGRAHDRAGAREVRAGLELGDAEVHHLHLPAGSIMMFAGLMSRWTTWFSCAWSSAAAACAMSAIVSPSGRRPRSCSSACSVRPSTSSITMKLVTGERTMSCVVTMFGCRRRAATCASRWKRCLTSSSIAGSTNASSRISFTATSRPSTLS